MLVLLLAPQGAATAGLDVTAAIDAVIPALNASSPADLVYWTESELYEWADEAAKRLAGLVGGFVERDTSIALVIGTAVYALPARHLSTIHAGLDGESLRPSTVQEIEALDGTWPETAGDPARWIADSDGLGRIRVYPSPASSGAALEIVFHRFPATVEASAAVILAPSCLREYFTFAVLGEARGKESKMAMPDVAGWARSMTGLYEEVCRQYWGEAL